MTNEQVKTIAKKYLDLLLSVGWEIEKTSTGHDFRQDSDEINHVSWMLNEIISGAVTDSKAERWLCFAQGVLWCHRFYSIDQMREDNRE